MRRSIQGIIAVIALGGALLPQLTWGQEISDEVMRDITNTVRSLCNSPDRQGSDISIEGSVEGGAIVKMLGIGGEVSLSQSQWEGIQDFLSDRANLRDCVRHLTPIFIENFKLGEGSGITRSQIGNICRSSQHFELCLDTWTARGSIASVGLSLWNTSGTDIKVCMYERYAYAVSEQGEIAELRSNRFCWNASANNSEKLSYAFEFDKGPVGDSFDFSLEFEQPHSQFIFHDIMVNGGSRKDKTSDADSTSTSRRPDDVLVTKEKIGQEFTVKLSAGEWTPWSKLSPGVCMLASDLDGAELWVADADREPRRHKGGRETFLYFILGAQDNREASPRYRFNPC